MENRIRNKRVTLRLTENEYNVIYDKSKYLKMNMNEYLRKMALDGVIVKVEKENIIDIIKLINEMNHIGVNINQIAKKINENGGMYDQTDIADVKKQYENLFEMVTKEVYGIK